MSKSTAFTLAETLITVAIIGIVAALTIPSLISSYKQKVYSVRLKKFYSTMNEAIKLSEIENGSIEGWSHAPLEYEENGSTDYEKNEEKSYTFIAKYLLPYLNYTKVERNADLTYKENVLKTTKVYLSDGSIFYSYNGSCVDFFYDVNGEKKPNSEGIDSYRFLICNHKSDQISFFGNKNQYFGTYGIHNSTTPADYREFIKVKCAQLGKYCSDLIRIDNWEYKKDYPYKL